MFNKLKQFKDLRSQAKELQNKLAEESVEVESNWGKIKMKINGNTEILNLDIDSSLIVKENKESIQKDLINLFNDGVKKIQKKVAQKMAKDGNMPNIADIFK